MAFNRIIHCSFWLLFICSYPLTNGWGLYCWNPPWSSSLMRFFLLWFYSSYTKLPGTFHSLTEPGIFCCDKILFIVLSLAAALLLPMSSIIEVKSCTYTRQKSATLHSVVTDCHYLLIIPFIGESIINISRVWGVGIKGRKSRCNWRIILGGAACEDSLVPFTGFLTTFIGVVPLSV